MSHRYLLPCPGCHQPLPVSTTQAGETLTCGCGRVATIPTLREIKALPLAPSAVADIRTRSTWSVQRGLVFVSGALLIAASVLAYWQIAPRRRALDIRRPDFVELTIDVQQLTPLQAWDAWEHFRDQKLEFRDTPKFIENRAKYRELSYYLYTAAAGACLGSALILGSTLWR